MTYLSFILLSLCLVACLVLLIYGFSTPLAQAGCILIYVLADGAYLGWGTFFTVLVVGILAEVIEFFSGVRGARNAQGSRLSAAGAILGGIIGAALLTPFFPIGPIAGSFLGTFAGAIIFEFFVTSNVSKAVNVGMSATISRIAGFCIKTAISVGILFGVIGNGIVQMFVS